MINVCFGLHDADGKYSKFVGATMVSIFENSFTPPPIPSITVHILHDATLTDDNRDKFSYLAGRYGQSVKFHNVEKLCADEINFLREKLADKLKMRFSVGTFYRLLIKKILGTGKVIYLDADIIVNLDISELWQQNLQNFPVAAVPEIDATQHYMIDNKFLLKTGFVKLENYFCAGVMIFNLDKLDEKFFYNGVQFLADNPACEAFDQDILNAFFSENYLKLEEKFDSFVASNRRTNSPVTKKIYHYAGQTYGLDADNPYDKLFLENFSRTPFFNAETPINFGKELRNLNDQYAILNQWLMKISVNHRRAFYVDAHNVQVVKILFSVCDDELIIEYRDGNSVNELLAKMEEQRGQTVFFILQSDYENVIRQLMNRGFSEFQNFINGFFFLTREQGKYTRPEGNFVRTL